MARRDKLIRAQLRQRFLITTYDAGAFDGVLLEVDDRHLVLADAEQVAPNGDRLKVDGHLWLDRVDVAYMQQPNP